jgi:glycosyltransferase involved in cell wall biosynthesis
MSKIIYLGEIYEKPKTGGQKYNSKVLLHLQRSGFSVEECDAGSYKLPFSFLRIIAMNVAFVKSVMPLLEEDTIVVEDVYSNLQTVFLNLLMKVRRRGILVGICHHLFVREKQNILLRAACYLAAFCMLRFFNAIITVSSSTKKDLIRFGVSKGKIWIIPNATEAPQVGRQTHESEEMRILFVGTCYPRKGLHHLLEAVAMLKGYKIKVDIVGDMRANRAYVKRLRSMLNKHGIAHLVTFHGLLYGESFWQKFVEADMFVMPSFWESFGIVFLDAMSFGLPIITTNAGAIPDLVKHEENGLLVRPGDTSALASAIERLVISPSFRRKLGQNGFKFMQDHKEYSSWDLVGERFRSVIGSLKGERAC